MARVEFFERREIVGRGVDCLRREGDEKIGDTTEGGDDHNSRRVKPVYDLLDLQYGFGRTHGRTAEFENFHRESCIEMEK